MRYLVGEVSAGREVQEVYQDPPAEPGTLEDALSNTLISTLDPAPMAEAEADRVLTSAERCRFNRSPESDPILWAAQNGNSAAMKLNGILVPLETSGDLQGGNAEFRAPGLSLTVRTLGDEADWRSDAELVFRLDQGLTVGYRGFFVCGA